MVVQGKLIVLNEDLKIPRKKRSLTKAEKFYSNIKIPSKNSILFAGRYGNKKDDCGKFKSAYVCKNGYKTHIILKSCNNRDCPNCYITALRRLNSKISQRILKILILENLPYFNHITFSRKEEEYPEEMDSKFYSSDKAKFLRVLKKYNASGVVFFHAYRKNKDNKTMRYSPHYHLLGRMWIPSNFYEKHKFICKKIKNKKTNKTVKIGTEKHIKSLVGYLLTHTTYFENTKMTTWIGDYSYAKLRMVNKHYEYEEILCPVCKKPLYRLGIDQPIKPLFVDNEYYYFTKYWRSSLGNKTLHRKKLCYDLKKVKKKKK